MLKISKGEKPVMRNQSVTESKKLTSVLSFASYDFFGWVLVPERKRKEKENFTRVHDPFHVPVWHEIGRRVLGECDIYFAFSHPFVSYPWQQRKQHQCRDVHM